MAACNEHVRAGEGPLKEIQYPFNPQLLEGNRIEGNFFNVIKSIYENLSANMTYGGLNAFLLGSGTRQDYLSSPFLLNIVLEVQISAKRQEKEIKSLHIVFIQRWYD